MSRKTSTNFGKDELGLTIWMEKMQKRLEDKL